MASPAPAASRRDEITLYMPEGHKRSRRLFIGTIAFALILAVSSIVAPCLGLGVTGCILLGIGAAIIMFGTISTCCIKSRKDTKEASMNLLDAASRGSVDDVKTALSFVGKGKMGDGADVNCKDVFGRTPLNIAATKCAKNFAMNDIFRYHNHLEVIAILLKNGADKNIVLFEDGTSLTGVQKVEAEIKQLVNELQPLHKPTLADRLFKW
ncbi:MAG: hypothetical protein K1000chlam4_00780 [Chlamydiae bacterium]|nr:hypothetical protein [Chlamydiota bacterium]